MSVPEADVAVLRHPGRLYIGGQWVAPSTDNVIEVIQPSTEEVFLRVAEAKEADVARAVSAARDAFDEIVGITSSRPSLLALIVRRRLPRRRSLGRC